MGIIAGLIVSEKTSAEKHHFKIREIVLALIILLQIFYSLQYQRNWREASGLTKRIIDEVVRATSDHSAKFYLANLPVELGEAPVFGGQ